MKTIFLNKPLITILFTALCNFMVFAQSRGGENHNMGHIRGSVTSTENESVFATVFLKGTTIGVITAQDGSFHLTAPAGNYTLVASSLGFETQEIEVVIIAGQTAVHNMIIVPDVQMLGEVVVSTASCTRRMNRSAYNVTAIDTRAMQNTTLTLGDALARVPGVRLRESGGVGSDMQLMLDGFSGRHVKVFIDGVPMEGVGGSFGLNNIPVNFAERIEVFRGVVPVGFGTDAIGGVVNIVTRREQINRNRWFLDASYSFGSFNTHKSHINFGRTRKNGLTYEINLFQNYSDNNYYINTRVFHFVDFPVGGTRFPREEFRVRRFHDKFRNEVAVGRIGVVNQSWADRLMFGLNYSQSYNEIQNGVRQEIVFGGRFRRGHSIKPSVEYSKRNLFVEGLDIRLTANVNLNQTDHVDTSRYEFNWFGEKRLRATPGEQRFQHLRQNNNNWNATFNLNYRIGEAHLFTLNHTLNAFSRKSRDLLIASAIRPTIPNENRKSVTGFSYRLMPSERWNVSVFGKYYTQYASGLTQITNSRDFEEIRRSKDFWGYGVTGTFFITEALQAKFSYEKACRMPTNIEMFGDGDLEGGSSTLRPESSHNLNFSLNFDRTFGNHSVFVEGTFIYRNTRDHIMRGIFTSGMGGLEMGQSINHGNVLTKGYNIAASYTFSRWLRFTGRFTHMNARNNVRTTATQGENITYGMRMPNLPYIFANTDLTFYWHDFVRKGNVLTFAIDNMYMHRFPLNFAGVGDPDTKRFVPTQLAHNVRISYSMRNGRYNISFECHNITNARLYDSFSLQRPGRAFSVKLRASLNND